MCLNMDGCVLFKQMVTTVSGKPSKNPVSPGNHLTPILNEKISIRL